MNAPVRKPPVAKSTDMIESTLGAAKDAMENLFDPSRVAKNYESAVAFGQANLAAAVQAGNAALAGAREVSQIWLALSQSSVNDGVSALRRLGACKSTPELVEAQSELTRAAYAKFANESRKLSEISMKLAESVSAPVVARTQEALHVLAKPTAA